MSFTLTLDDVRRAAAAVAPHVHRTPLVRSSTFSAMSGYEVYLKCENLQRTGCFKPRGALNRIQELSSQEAKRGVLCASAGNHAQGVAYAASARQIPVTVVMPRTAPAAKVEATRSMGATVVLEGEIFDDALSASLELQRRTGMTYIHPCTDRAVMAGAGTIGLEIAEDLPEVGAVVVPIGGGALISGVATSVRAQRPDARIFGVEPATAPAMERSFTAGALVTLDSARSIADGMAGRAVFQVTLDHVRALCAGVLLLSEAEILNAIRLLLSRAKLLTEGAGAAPLGAILKGLPGVPPGTKVVAVLSGGNMDLDLLAGWIREGLPS